MLDIKITQVVQDKGFPWKEALTWTPHLIWAALAIILLLAIGPSRLRDALFKASKIGIAGLEVEFRSAIEAAANARNLSLPPQLSDRLARRLERLQQSILGKRVLWIDDNPKGNSIEIGILNSLGAIIDIAESNLEAEWRLGSAVYDFVLSDMSRGGDVQAGEKFLSKIADAILSPRVIFYVGNMRGVPKDAFGLTNRPDDLFHLICDAVERGSA